MLRVLKVIPYYVSLKRYYVSLKPFHVTCPNLPEFFVGSLNLSEFAVARASIRDVTMMHVASPPPVDKVCERTSEQVQ